MGKSGELADKHLFCRWNGTLILANRREARLCLRNAAHAVAPRCGWFANGNGSQVPICDILTRVYS